MHNIVTGQAIIKHETTDESSVGISNPKIRAEINYRLGNELNDVILTPVIGIQKIRKVLHRYSLDIPALYELEPEGDEVVLEMNQFGEVHDFYALPQLDDYSGELYYLYVLYYLTDNGDYDFYAELTDEAGIERIFQEDDEELSYDKDV